MQRRWLIRLSLLAVLAAFAVWLEPTRVVWGWLRGEVFYDGRPTSYWAGELERWDYSVLFAMGPNRICHMHHVYARNDSRIETWWKGWFPDDATPPTPKLLTGDTEADAVLTALKDHPSDQVRKMAEHGLEQSRRYAAWREATEHEDAQERP